MFSHVLQESGPRTRDTAERNLAFDEALVRCGPARPVVWCWWNPPTVVLGRGQRIEREVDLGRCAVDGVPVLRRCTGGGGVYHDDGNLNLSLVLPGAARPPLEILAAVLVATATTFGLRATATDRGVFVGHPKLAGLAGLRGADAALAHAALLVDTPAERVMRYLNPQPADPHPTDSRRGPVAALREHGVRAEHGDVVAAALAACTAELGTRMPRPADAGELGWQRRLLRTRYRHPHWHLRGRQVRAEPGEREKEGVWTAKRVSTSTG